MRKRDELTHGCMSRARDDEMTFVLLGRDAAAPVAIRAWIAERIRLGKNQPGDSQVTDAEMCARTMEAERDQPGVRRQESGDRSQDSAIRFLIPDP